MRYRPRGDGNHPRVTEYAKRAAVTTLVVGGVVYVRLAERNERDFAELVERS